MRSAPWTLLPLGLLALAGCLDLAPPRFDASIDAVAADPLPPSIERLEVRDARGRPWDPLAAPRSPRFLAVASEALSSDDGFVFLFRGAPDEVLLDDLSAPPMRADSRERLEPLLLEREGPYLGAEPVRPLAPGTPYAVVVPGWVRGTLSELELGEAVAVEVRASADPAAGAAVVDSWPADGMAGVTPALGEIALRLDGIAELSGAVLVVANGAPHPGTLGAIACPEIGWDEGYCHAWRPSRPLPADAIVDVAVAGAIDATGSAVPPWSARILTAAAPDLVPPTFSPLACGIDERAFEGGCLFTDDRRLSVRTLASEPARIELTAGSQRVTVLATRGDAAFEVAGLTSDTSFAVRLAATDVAGLSVAVTTSAATTEPLATVSISEVLSDPRGREPVQELVEIVNFGPEPVDIVGFTISDRADILGDAIPVSSVVPARGRALLVADDFDPEDPADGPIPPGVRLIRVGRSIGTGGLSNAGEALFLRDPWGRRVSAFAALESPGAGVCWVRASEDPRTGAPAAFAVDAEGSCTPGHPDRLPDGAR